MHKKTSCKTSSLAEDAIESLSYFPDLRKELAEWYEANKRDLPWRQTDDPYHIWISEIILQQTRVEQGRDYYYRFLDRFPDVFTLADASEDSVMKMWEGLGYYSRARNLHKAAKMIVSDFGGRLPQTKEEIIRLPGIGDYTAAAILSFAYHLPFAAVDGNIFRVISRLMNIDTPINTPAGKKVFTAWADALMDRKFPALHNQAIMEFGALYCTPTSPLCLMCPLRRFCLADAMGRVEDLPVKKGKVSITNRYLNYLYVRVITPKGRFIYIRRRPSGDIWQGLYEFPCVELNTESAPDDLMASDKMQDLLRCLPNVRISGPFKTLKHLLTHRRLWIAGYCLEVDLSIAPRIEGYKCIPEDGLSDYALPRALNLLIDAL